MNSKRQDQVDPNIGLTITCNAFSRRRAGLLAAHSNRSLTSTLDGSSGCARMKIPDMTVKAQALLKRKEEERTTCLYALREVGSRPMQQPTRRPSNPHWIESDGDKEAGAQEHQEREETEEAVPIPALDRKCKTLFNIYDSQFLHSSTTSPIQPLREPSTKTCLLDPENQDVVFAAEETPLTNSKQPLRLASARTMEPASPPLPSNRRESMTADTVISAITLVASTTTEEEEEDDDILSEEEELVEDEDEATAPFHDDIVLDTALLNTRWKSAPEPALRPAATFPLIEEEGEEDVEEEEEEAEDVEALKQCLLDLGQRIQAMEAEPGVSTNKIQGIQASFKGLLDQLQGTVSEDSGKKLPPAEKSNPQEAIKDPATRTNNSTRKSRRTDPSEKNHSSRKSRSTGHNKKLSKRGAPSRVLSSEKTKSRSSSSRTAESTSTSSIPFKCSSGSSSKTKSKSRSESSRLSASHGCLSYTHDVKKRERRASTTGARPRRTISADSSGSGKPASSKNTTPRRVTSNDSNASKKGTKGSRGSTTSSDRRRKEGSITAESPRRRERKRETHQPLDLKHLYGGTDHSGTESAVTLAPPTNNNTNNSSRSTRSSTNNSTRSTRSTSQRTTRSSATTATGATIKASGRSSLPSGRRKRQ